MAILVGKVKRCRISAFVDADKVAVEAEHAFACIKDMLDAPEYVLRKIDVGFTECKSKPFKFRTTYGAYYRIPSCESPTYIGIKNYCGSAYITALRLYHGFYAEYSFRAVVPEDYLRENIKLL